MTDRPSISASLLADINDSVASRTMRKLDKDPDIASTWAWEKTSLGWKVDSGSECVHLNNQLISSIEDVQCSCLLHPRCFHILAVSNVLPLAEDTAGRSEGIESVPPDESSTVVMDDLPQDHSTVVVSQDQSAAAKMMTTSAGSLLSGGLRAAGGASQSRLLRAIHECRATGLHRLAAAGLRVLSHARTLRSTDQDFDVEMAVQSLHELFLVARKVAMSAERLPLAWLGTARRRYRPVASLKLFGLCCEPVLTASGYAGVVTWMLTDQLDVVSVSDVQPGDVSRIPQAWKSSVTLAGLAMSHAELSQQKLLVSKATLSDDGRVGGSDSARAVPAKHEGWNCREIEARFSEPLDEQIQRYFQQRDAVGQTANEGSSLMFLKGSVCGFEDRFLMFQLEQGSRVRLEIASDTSELPFRENLIMLARVPDLPLRCIGRLNPVRPGLLQLLSISAEQNSDTESKGEQASNHPTLLIKEPGAHYDLGLHRLQRSQFSNAHRQPVEVSDFPAEETRGVAVESPFGSILQDWLAAIAVGGRHALSGAAVNRLARDARYLESNFQPTSAAALKTLASQALDTTTNMEGIRFAGDAQNLSLAWLATAIVQSASQQHQQHSLWNSGIETD